MESLKNVYRLLLHVLCQARKEIRGEGNKILQKH